LLDEKLRDDAGDRGRNRGDRLLAFEFEDGLVFRHRVAFLDEQTDDHATVCAFTEFWEFEIHSALN